jgi:PKD repeat protein
MKVFSKIGFMVLMCLITSMSSFGQDSLINKIEYFIDTDPGVGMATTLFESTGDDTISLVNQSINIPALPQGIHHLYLRVRYVTGMWSVVGERPFFVTVPASNDSIVAAEYFVDSDPGAGNGMAVAVNVADSIRLTNQILPTSGLDPGIHHLFARVKSSTGLWTVSTQRSFYVVPQLTTDTIAQLEYFVDIDPGFGNGTPIAVSASDSVKLMNQILMPTGLTAGIHHLFVRAKSVSGLWSVASQKSFYAKPGEEVFEITALEYFYDSDPGAGNGFPLTIAAGDSVLLNQFDFPQNALPIGSHVLFVRAKSSKGLWTIIYERKFNVCTNYGALSQMEFQVEGNKVFFTNLSEYNTHTHWNFGDNTMDTVLSPIKTYLVPGNYNVQLISTNECAADTLSVMLSIRGIQRINATRSGNSGIATVFFEGNGFAPTSVIKLKKGSTELLPVDRIWQNPTRITAYFDLNGAEPGNYDVIALLNGGALDTLKNGFRIDNARPIYVEVNDVSGGRSRLNRMRPEIHLQNAGNEDAIMVPVTFMLGHNPNATNIIFSDVSEKFVDLSALPFFQDVQPFLSTNNISASNISPMDFDSIRRRHLYSFIRVKIPSESFVSTRFKNENPALHPSYNIGMKALPPMFPSSIALNLNDSIDIRDCISSFMKKAVRKNLGLPLVNEEWDACFNVAYDSLRSTVKYLVRDFAKSQQSIPFKALYTGLLVKMTQCTASGMPSSINNAKFTSIIRDFMNNWIFLESLDSIGMPCFNAPENYILPSVAGNLNENAQGRNVPAQRSVPGCDSGAAQAFPELAEMCSDLVGPDEKLAGLAGGGFAGFVVKKLIKTMSPKGPGGGVGGGLGLNTASAKCKDFCESGSFDPNEKTGPGDNAENVYDNNLNHISYRIGFENKATATANAAYVEIVDTLDKSVFDLSTFQIGNMGWGDSLVNIDANRQSYSFLKDLRPAHPNYLRVDVRLDTVSGEARWQFFTLDTTTLQLTEDPSQGFLPPNVSDPEGQGFVSFIIGSKEGATSGTTFTNEAKIIFDDNAPIYTEPWFHIADTTKPESMVLYLAPNVPTKDFVVQWQGADAHSGVDKFQTFVSINDEPYITWNAFIEAVSDTFHGKFGYTYKFYSISKDKAGNYEPAPAAGQPDAETTPLSIGQVISVKDGEWHDPTTWSNNAVPDINTDLIVKHLVHISMNGVCKKATLIPNGNLILDEGKRLDIITN